MGMSEAVMSQVKSESSFYRPDALRLAGTVYR